MLLRNLQRRKRWAVGGAHDEAGTVFSEPLDGPGQHVDAAEPVLDCGDHKVPYVLALDALDGGNMGQ